MQKRECGDDVSAQQREERNTSHLELIAPCRAKAAEHAAGTCPDCRDGPVDRLLFRVQSGKIGVAPLGVLLQDETAFFQYREENDTRYAGGDRIAVREFAAQQPAR